MKKFIIACCLLLSTFMVSQANAFPVNLELALLVDVSGSVDSSEYALQKNGYINAFNNIASFGNFQPFAVTYIEWSGASQALQKVGWTLISNVADAVNFATAISATTRSFSGLTAPGSAINFAFPLFSSNGYEGSRLVIDVSGDGSQNDGASTSAARNSALLAGITQINGLPILGSESGLLQWYQNNIQGGTGSFTIAANSFDDFEDAVHQKLQREIVPTVPEPATMLLMGVGLANAAFIRWRRQRKLSA